MKLNHALPLFLAASLVLGGCTDSSNHDFDKSAAEAQQSFDQQPASGAIFEATFDPAQGLIPSTNNLLFSGSADGTLNIPVDDSDTDGEKALKATLNELDGFSTVAPVTAAFSSSIDQETVSLGGSVRVFEVSTTREGGVTGIVRELGVADLVATVAGQNLDTLAIVPVLQPLKPSASYLVVLTNGIKDTAGTAAQADVAYVLAKKDSSYADNPDLAALEPVRQLVNNYEAVAAAAGIDKESIILSWTFNTQSIGDVLQAVFDDSEVGTVVVAPTGKNTREINDQLAGVADVYIGTLTVPYYLDAAAPLSGSWKGAEGSALTRFNTAPVKTSDQTIPLLMTLPNTGEAPEAGWPIVIFQHGITRNRTDLLALADGLAGQGIAAVAIDMPLHGLVDVTNPLHADNPPFEADVERTFALDVLDNASGAPVAGGDGAVDESGASFINLASLLTSRDNVRQAASDLFVLRKSLAGIAGVPVNAGNVNFIGHSLGGIVGTLYLAFDDTVKAASLAMAGGGIARLLDGSATFGPRIEGGLALNGVIKGTADYDAFMVVAQTALDSGDPVNYGARVAAAHPIHFMEVVGGNTTLPDQVIPNNVPGAPLSGTDPLVTVMGLADVTGDAGPDVAGIRGIVRFIAGDHGSILDPTASIETTREMQTETVSFMASGGALIQTSADGPGVIKQ